MKLDSRLYFINDPYLYIPLLLCLALLGFVFKQERPKAKVKVKESVTIDKSDTTECIENKGRFLYNTK